MYEAGGSVRALYSPGPLAEATRSTPLPSSRTVTVAPVTRLPFGSLTVTCRSPLATPWPKATEQRVKATTVGIRIFGIRINLSAQENASNRRCRIRRWAMFVFGKRRWAGFTSLPRGKASKNIDLVLAEKRPIDWSIHLDSSPQSSLSLVLSAQAIRGVLWAIPVRP